MDCSSLLLFTISSVILMCLTTQGAEVQSDTQAMLYLSRYGFLKPISPESGTIISADTLTNAISEFQIFAGINATGKLDNETQELMSLPRCGVKDRVGAGQSRSKRYALQGSRWRVKDLTYRIAKYPRNLDQDKVDVELNKAFNVWSAYTDLTFTQKTSGHVHIEVRFERGEHGDGDPFDGPGGTLAHAYFPVYGGDAHFDDSEQWTIDSYRGTNLFQVAAHEFGHSLGLSHSDVRSALMAPFYRGYQSSFELDEDDIQAIQALYDKKKKSTTEAPTFRNSIDKILCDDPSVNFDTIFNSADGETYVFKGDKFWKLTEEAIAPGYPKPISSSWKGLPGNIDAAFTYRNGKTYFFKGSQYWRYVGKRMDGDYPKLISEGFTGIPDNVDAALVWSGNGKIYFYKGSKFWRFDPVQKPPVKQSYPKPISNWEGIPNNLDAAFQYVNGYTYFFKGGKYWRFDDKSFSVDHGNPPFPRPSGFWWFGCPEGTTSKPSSSSGGGIFNFLGFLNRDADIQDDQVDDLILDAVEKPADNREATKQQAEHKGVQGQKDNGASIPSINQSFLLAVAIAMVVSGSLREHR